MITSVHMIDETMKKKRAAGKKQKKLHSDVKGVRNKLTQYIKVMEQSDVTI